MSRSVLPAAAGAVVLSIAMIAALAQTGAGERTQSSRQASYATADEAEFEQVIPGVKKHTLWGDPEGGAYGSYTRFEPGFRAPEHTHTHDLQIVVLEGAYIYTVDGEETRVGPREFALIPGGLRHASRGDDEEGALFYEASSGPFDLVVVE